MSTATRGGRGRGRGRGRGGAGGGPPRKHRIAGQEMSWDYDPELDVKSEPQETFPVSEQYTKCVTVRQRSVFTLLSEYG